MNGNKVENCKTIICIYYGSLKGWYSYTRNIIL